MEYVGREPGQIFNSVHTRSSFGNTVNTKTTSAPDVEDDFHVFSMEWTLNSVQFFYDDDLVYISINLFFIIPPTTEIWATITHFETPIL